MAKLINLVGKKYGRLTVLSYLKNDKSNHRIYKCKCDCGNITNVLSKSLAYGKTKSCGCLHKELHLNRITKHGESHTHSKEYHAWLGMRKRCRDPKQKQYKDYGGRGITVCRRWDEYENFLSDMGRAPSKSHSIERIDNNGNYNPSNCRWATRVEQCNNTRRNIMIEYNSRVQSLPNWCRELKLYYPTVKARILTYGWDIERAFKK